MAIYYADGTNSSEGRIIKTTVQTVNTRASTTSTSYVGTGLELTSYAAETSTNQLLITVHAPISGRWWGATGFGFRFERDGSQIGNIGSGGTVYNGISNCNMSAHSSDHTHHFNFMNTAKLLYSPGNTTSSTYRVAWATRYSWAPIFITGQSPNITVGTSTFMIQEIAH